MTFPVFRAPEPKVIGSSPIGRTINAVVKYSNGINMSYSLNSFMPIEGYRIRDFIFRPGTSVPDYLELPGSRAGAMSCLTGIAARQSVESGKPVKIADLATL